MMDILKGKGDSKGTRKKKCNRDYVDGCSKFFCWCCIFCLVRDRLCTNLHLHFCIPLRPSVVTGEIAFACRPLAELVHLSCEEDWHSALYKPTDITQRHIGSSHDTEIITQKTIERRMGRSNKIKKKRKKVNSTIFVNGCAHACVSEGAIIMLTPTRRSNSAEETIIQDE